MFKSTNFKVPTQEENLFLTYENFEGINISNTPTQITKNESPDMLNMLLDDQGALDSRTGFEAVFDASLGAGQINGFYTYEQTDGTIKYLLHWKTTLYTTLLDGTAPTSIKTGLTDHLTNFFTFNDKCYIMDSTHYFVYDGSTVADVTVNGNNYIPRLTLGRAPAGGGTANENFNLLGAGFNDSFSADGTATAYTLSLAVLDATEVTATVDGATKVEDTDFTVDRTSGVVTFTVAPTAGTNNVVITAYKTITGNADKILKCLSFVIYGGTNDTRIFWARNADFPNYLFRSGLFDPTYAPDLAFVKVGSDAGIIQGFAKQFSSCVILKAPTPNDTTQWSMSYSLAADGTVTFPIIPLTDDIGLVAPRSIQILNGVPTYHSQKGVFQTIGSNVKDERNVIHISEKIDRSYNNQIQALLAETNAHQAAALSVDYDKKYILVVNGRAYVYDYRRSTLDKQIWYIWDNINASCFLEIDDYLYFGSSSIGQIYKFLKSNDVGANSDDGTAINKYWTPRIEDFGVPFRYKSIPNAYLTLKPAITTSANLYTIDDEGEVILQDTIGLTQFSYVYFDYSNFSYITTNFPQILPSRVKLKKVLFSQFKVSNDTNNQSLGILSLNVEYTVNGLAK